MVGALQAFARATPSFRGKYRAFRLAYGIAGVSVNTDYCVRMRKSATEVVASLGSAIESQVLCLGEYDPGMGRFFDKIIKPSWTCIDVGANVGYHTVRMAERTQHLGLVLAIEPNAGLHGRLKRNVQRLQNVVIADCAIADRVGMGTLFVNDTRTCDNHNATMVAGACASDARLVPVRTLDDIWRTDLTFRPVHLVKLDVEGYEYKALAGAREMLRASTPTIVMEYNGPYANAMGYSLREVISLVQDCGEYRAWRLQRSGALAPVSSSGTGDLFDLVLVADGGQAACG